MNVPGMFKDGRRLREWNTKDSPAFSGRLLPEFDRRRSIKDMFSRKPSSSQPTKIEKLSQETSTAIDRSSTIPMEKQQTNGNVDMESSQQSQTSISSQPIQTRPPSSPDKKRPAIGSAATKTTKKRKPSASAQSQPSPAKGQRSLKGFFKPTVTLPRDDSSISTTTAASLSTTPASLPLGPTRTTSPPPVSPLHSSRSAPSRSLSKTLPPEDAAAEATTTTAVPRSPSPPFIDPIVSKESWDKLFTKRSPPRCEDHDEPCISLTTKKPGMNCGRAFWMCPRPIGPSGAKEKGTEWRCGTFVWASEWNG